MRGVFDPARFLDLVGNFITFSDEHGVVVKRLAKYHQFHAVNKAVDTTIAAIERQDGRAGVVWHTQGSGKSLEMLFYVGKIMRHPAMANPTVVMLTDRNDLDDQLFDEVFAPARTLPETPVQAGSREHLRELLLSKASGGIVFSTMQKFGLTRGRPRRDRSFPGYLIGGTSWWWPTRHTEPSTTLSTGLPVTFECPPPCCLHGLHRHANRDRRQGHEGDLR